MPTLDLPPSERIAALDQFLAESEDPDKAREFVLSVLDVETDADLLDHLANNQPPQ